MWLCVSNKQKLPIQQIPLGYYSVQGNLGGIRPEVVGSNPTGVKNLFAPRDHSQISFNGVVTHGNLVHRQYCLLLALNRTKKVLSYVGCHAVPNLYLQPEMSFCYNIVQSGRKRASWLLQSVAEDLSIQRANPAIGRLRTLI